MIDLMQDGVSAQRVLRALCFEHGRRETSFELYALRGGVRMRRLSLYNHELRCDNTADVKFTGRFTVRDAPDVDWYRDLLGLDMLVRVDEKTLRYPFPRLRAVKVSGFGELTVEAGDETILLAQSSIGDVFIPAGTRYVPFLEKTLAAAGFRSTEIEPCDAAFSCDREDWTPQTALLDFVNGLLGEMGYHTLSADAAGVLRARRYRPANEAAQPIRYTAGAYSVLLRERERVIDGFRKPNRFVGMVSNPDAGPLRYEWVNDDPSSPSSPQRNGGYTLTAVRQYGHIADPESLALAVRRWAAEIGQQTETIVIRTAAMPHHGAGETVALDCEGFRGLFAEAGWCISGDCMTHTLRRLRYD